MAISHRLQSSMYVRPDEGMNEQPKRIVFLSVEGNVTEKNYFDLVNQYSNTLGIKSVVHIETLSRVDTKSDPVNVLSLLDDSKKLREEGISATEVFSAIKEYIKGVSEEQIKQYFNDELQGEDRDNIESQLRIIGIDLSYQKYLSDIKGDKTSDVFAVVVDRDCRNHPETVMKRLILSCQKNGYGCYITNPCFEFWLLLHVCDVKKEFLGQMEDIKKNAKISRKHTFVSKELSIRAGHSKSITDEVFKRNYLLNVDLAIERAKSFELDRDQLLDHVGSNLPELFEVLRS